MGITQLTQIATMTNVAVTSVLHGIRWWFPSATSFSPSTGIFDYYLVFFSSGFDNFSICFSSINFLIYCSVGEKFKTIVLRFCRNILATSGRGKKPFRISSGKPDFMKFHYLTSLPLDYQESMKIFINNLKTFLYIYSFYKPISILCFKVWSEWRHIFLKWLCSVQWENIINQLEHYFLNLFSLIVFV